MDDLVEWLKRQLDEDERVAKQAADLYPTPWRFERDSAVDANGDDMALGYDDSGAILGEHAEHIVRHDPARILREVEAKRRIMDLHRPVRKRSTSGLGEDIIEDCQMCDHFPAQYPCATIRLLALPYAGRPGYQEEWRP